MLDRVLARKALRYGSKASAIGRKGPVIITIGTPVDEFLNPELGPVKKCIDDLLPFVDDGQLIVLRSTLYPGTTDWLHRYLEDLGRKLLVAYCPERVVQGFGIVELKGLPQIVSGTSQEAEDKAAELFARIAPEIVRVTALEAEFAKIFTNVYRYVEFAATNQFYMIAHSAGADYRRHFARDEAQLSPSRTHSGAWLFSGAVPVQGHDAACRLLAEQVRSRFGRNARERGPRPACGRPSPPDL